jgi:hypothetical protein
MEARAFSTGTRDSNWFSSENKRHGPSNDFYKRMQKMSIIYKFPEEIEFAKHYAEKLNDELTLSILNAGEVKNSAEARHLSMFFWNMVDRSIEDRNNKLLLPWPEGGSFGARS